MAVGTRADHRFYHIRQSNGLLRGNVSHWRGDDATDYRGNHNGTFENGANSTTGGLIGNRFEFDQASPSQERVNLGDVATLNFTNQMAVSAWCMRRQTFPESQTIISKHNTVTADRSWRCTLVNNGFKVALSSDGTARGDTTASFTLVQDQWYHLVYSYDGTLTGGDDDETNALRLRIFVDGVEHKVGGSPSRSDTFTGLTVFPATLNISSAEAMIGAHEQATTGTQDFDGWIDELSIWDRPLELYQVQALYNGGTPLDVADYD